MYKIFFYTKGKVFKFSKQALDLSVRFPRSNNFVIQKWAFHNLYSL